MIELTHYSCWKTEGKYKGTLGETWPRYHLSLNVQKVEDDDLEKLKKEIVTTHKACLLSMPKHVQIAFPEPTFYPKVLREHSS